jgi:thiol-disulfide isomerase/thioredoxin
VVASTLEARANQFDKENVISQSYTQKHMGQIFEDGLSFSGFEKDKVWLNAGDQLLDVSDVSGADDDGDGRALCVADFDDDGDPDFFVHNIQRERHMLYRNDVDAGARGVKVQVRATKGPWQAPGAIVRAKAGGRTTAQVVSVGNGFVSQTSPELLFGCGDAPAAELTVHWPGRAVESFGTVKAGSSCLLVEGSGEPQEAARRTFRMRDPGVPGLKVAIGAKLGALAVIDGKTRKPAELALGGRKKPLVVNLWATYCKACVGEMPDLQKLAERGDREVVALGLDSDEDFARADKLLDQSGVKFGRCFMTPALVEKLLDPTRLPLPTTLFFDSDGTLVEVLQTTIDHWSGWQPSAAR